MTPVLIAALVSLAAGCLVGYRLATANARAAEWWQQRRATFTDTDTYAEILAGRRNRATADTEETDRG